MVHPDLATQTAQVFPYTIQVYYYDYIEIPFPREKNRGLLNKPFYTDAPPRGSTLSLLRIILTEKVPPALSYTL